MEPIPTPVLTDPPGAMANATDTAICALLAAGPLPTAAIGRQLGVPERTIRHRLSQLRLAGAVISGDDGLHRLAEPMTALGDAGPVGLVTALPPAAAGPVLSLAAAAGALDQQATGGPWGGSRGRWGAVAVLAAIGVGLAAAALLGRRAPSPRPPAQAAPRDDAIDWTRWAVW